MASKQKSWRSGERRAWISRLTSADWYAAVLAESRRAPRALGITLPTLLRSSLLGRGSLVEQVLAHAKSSGNQLALEMGDRRWSWSELANTALAFAAVLRERGIGAGSVVAVQAQNSPEYLALVLGLSRLRAVGALLSPELVGEPLRHALREVRAPLLVHDSEPGVSNREAQPLSLSDLQSAARAVDSRALGRWQTSPLPRSDEDFVYIFTSGTTGYPKPCRVSHARAALAGAIFGPLVFEFRAGDKLYCPLPLHHSSGLLVGFGSSVTTKTPMVLREHFSASAFMNDVRRHGATAVLYVGETCRYLLSTPPGPEDREHALRVAVGNGLNADVWERFQQRFGVRQVREFYGATEAPILLCNLTGKQGSVGRVPLSPLLGVELVECDPVTGQLVRDDSGFARRSAPGEVGELLVRLDRKGRTRFGEYRGYTNAQASGRKLLHDVFAGGDCYYRSGDLFRRDVSGYYYFVDRIGSSFRYKSENVSASQVADTFCKAPEIQAALVQGIQVPGVDGRVGLAEIVPSTNIDEAVLDRAVTELPSYWCPVFVRVRSALPSTDSNKYKLGAVQWPELKTTEDPVYVLLNGRYRAASPTIWEQLSNGKVPF